MSIAMDRVKKQARVSQKKYAMKQSEKYGITKGAVTPALGDLFGDDDSSPLLKDQKGFMSLNSSLMYGSKRTYPENLPSTVRLSSKYNKATELDMEKAIRVAQYIYGTMEDHCLILSPKSLQLIASSDASYAEHADGRSHTGGCVGFESDLSCWVIHICNKQPVVAKSTCESELIAVNKVGDYGEWSIQFLEE